MILSHLRSRSRLSTTSSQRWLSSSAGSVVRIKNCSTDPSTIASTCSSHPTHASNYHHLTTTSPLTWYACGPTVYDVAHIGHARTYVATDILRRILTDYFHTPVNFAMGITDIDDKIINRGKEYGYSKNEEFEALARKFEFEFLEDMERLNVRSPDAILRVTEHIPQIITFIDSLVQKQHAYICQDGVYFNMSSLPSSFQYDRFGCVPPSIPDENEDNSGSSSITSSSSALPLTKKDPRDFALWKHTQESNPGWNSPWGWGRPGWHIECSTMTSEYFGQDLDIHSGGIDLQFPHHTNEIAQSECHHGHHWVKAWIHTGHLHIEGRKMSKSLKNFISIKDYFNFQLTSMPGDDFRIFCLLHKYNATLTYSEARIHDAASFRNKVESYFGFVENILKDKYDKKDNTSIYVFSRKPTSASKEIMKKLTSTQQSVHSALSDDFDTPIVLTSVGMMIGEAMQYATLLNSSSPSSTTEVHPLEPLLSVESYVRSILSILGLQFVQPRSSNSSASSTGASHDAIQTIVDFRSNIRSIATGGLKELKQLQKSSEANNIDKYKSMDDTQCKNILKITDKARTDIGESLKVTIDDIGSTGSSWRLK